jgi:hypothetical protein
MADLFWKCTLVYDFRLVFYRSKNAICNGRRGIEHLIQRKTITLKVKFENANRSALCGFLQNFNKTEICKGRRVIDHLLQRNIGHLLDLTLKVMLKVKFENAMRTALCDFLLVFNSNKTDICKGRRVIDHLLQRGTKSPT